MIRYDRRTFIKHSTMLAATAAAVRILPPSVSGSLLAPAFDWQSTPHPFFASSTNKPEVIAHRGGNGQWPGETLRAFREAAKLKPDILELDVFISLDGELIVMHDHEVNKTTEGAGEINKLQSTYLQSLNAGHKWSPDGKNFPFKNKSVLDPQCKDLRVPRLREVFEEFRGARMIIEMKKADRSPAQALSKMISEFEMKNNVLVASFVGKFMEEFRQLQPTVATSFSLSKSDLGKLISGKKLSKNDPADPRAIQLPYKLITAEIVRRARERNIKVHAWTVNDLDKMYLMWNLGVDGIITDYPGPLLALLGRTTAN